MKKQPKERAAAPPPPTPPPGPSAPTVRVAMVSHIDTRNRIGVTRHSLTIEGEVSGSGLVGHVTVRASNTLQALVTEEDRARFRLELERHARRVGALK